MMYDSVMRFSPLSAALSLSLFAMPVLLHAAGVVQTSSCTGQGSRDAARCATDTMKRWDREHYDYHADETKKHTTWHLEHDVLGVTNENLKAHRDYHEMAKRLHNAFHERMKREQQNFAQEHKEKRVTARNRPTTSRPGVSRTRLNEGMRRCSKYKSEQEIRCCTGC